MGPMSLRGHGGDLIPQPGGIAGGSGLDQVLGRGKVEIGAGESLDGNPEVAVPLMTPVILSWPEPESMRLPVRPRLILPAMSMVPVPARVTPPLPWEMRLPVMVVLPEPEINSVPLLALVMVPLMVSLFVGSPRLMAGSPPRNRP